jgi:hypothetical protein
MMLRGSHVTGEPLNAPPAEYVVTAPVDGTVLASRSVPLSVGQMLPPRDPPG